MLTAGEKKRVSSTDQVDTIKVYSFKDENIAGTFSNSLYGEDIAFENIMSLILLIEDCMNAISFPRPMASLRKLGGMSGQLSSRAAFTGTDAGEPPGYGAFPDDTAEPVAVFRLRIIFRTLSGWQGEIKDMGTGRKLTFKSDLELISFMVEEIRKKL